MKDIYKTRNLALASFLEAVGHPIKDIEIQKDGKIVADFIFASSQEIDIAVNNFMIRATKIEPQEYFMAIKNTKNKMYQKINEDK